MEKKAVGRARERKMTLELAISLLDDDFERVLVTCVSSGLEPAHLCLP